MHDEKRDVAIVLRQRSNLLSVLSIGHGRTEKLFYDTKKYSTYFVGSVVSYHVREVRHDYHRIEKLEVERHPSVYQPEAVYLLHALLEVCYHYIPLGTPVADVCSYVVHVLETLNTVAYGVDQKKTICMLFAILGLYPDKEFLPQKYHQVVYLPVDKLKDNTIELSNEELLDQWLAWCLSAYPQGKWCKALPLLLKSKA